MKQYEAVIKVMEENGGFATLGYLYQHVLKVEDCIWRTKTPHESIRRIVQDKRFFFKIRPGLWALNSRRHELPDNILLRKQDLKEKQEEYSHSYYQGLLVEIGNLKQFNTFVPNQDKNKLFLSKKLSDITTLPNILEFTYENIISYAKTIDVIWFNSRKMPSDLFEVEHTTDFHRSLLKFAELQDFYANFVIVADSSRKENFISKLSLTSFSSIKNRVGFWSYEQVAKYHSKTSELNDLGYDFN
ncbi:hypothetical protein J7L05_09190 [bacterium]|nr:hypothetical protein [bacterium]